MVILPAMGQPIANGIIYPYLQTPVTTSLPIYSQYLETKYPGIDNKQASKLPRNLHPLQPSLDKD